MSQRSTLRAFGLIEQSRGWASHEAVARRKCRTRFRRVQGGEGPGHEQRGGGSPLYLAGKSVQAGVDRCRKPSISGGRG